jgi:O-phosphoseryl-tRNA(Cys) synthetase
MRSRRLSRILEDLPMISHRPSAEVMDDLKEVLDSARRGELTGEELVGHTLELLHELGIDLPPPVCCVQSTEDDAGE